MSGIGDSDNSDLQRIREVNQSELRRRTDQAKRSQQARVERSFQQVMADRGRERMAQQAHRQSAPTTAGTREPASQRLLAQVRTHGQAVNRDQAKKAALSRSLAGGALKSRAKGHRTDAVEAETRADQLLTVGGEEVERVQDHLRDQDVQELRTTEEQQAEVTKEGPGDEAVDRDGKQRQQQHQGSGADEQASAEGAAAADNAARARPVQIPPALIQQLVNAVFKAVDADGRTQMLVHLRGGPLDGVKLEVRAEDGQVECTFHGCNREMEGLIKGGRQLLAGGLARRGLKLKSLAVK